MVSEMNIMYLKFGVMIVEKKLLLHEYDINNIQRKNAENMMHPTITHFMQFSTKSINKERERVLVLIYFFLANT